MKTGFLLVAIMCSVSAQILLNKNYDGTQNTVIDPPVMMVMVDDYLIDSSSKRITVKIKNLSGECRLFFVGKITDDSLRGKRAHLKEALMHGDTIEMVVSRWCQYSPATSLDTLNIGNVWCYSSVDLQPNGIKYRKRIFLK